jgi:hypothetical protein
MAGSKEAMMADSTPAANTLDREFLAIRSRMLDVAAALDRIDRAADVVADDPRLMRIRRGLEILITGPPQRAEQVQREFSL